jgi:hypothetical protein
MADIEKKPDVTPSPTSEDGEPKPTSVPNPSPSDEAQKKIKDLEDQLKDRDTKIADLSTTVATIEERLKQVNIPKDATEATKDVQVKVKKILEIASFDPDTASAELTNLLTEIQTNASKAAITTSQAQSQINTTIEKLKQGVQKANPEFDEDVVDTIMIKADELARTGKYKTAQEAIDAATQFVKAKFEAYASKKNATPPLPEGAKAEAGANKPPEPSPKPEVVLSPLEELEKRKESLQKKIL